MGIYFDRWCIYARLTENYEIKGFQKISIMLIISSPIKKCNWVDTSTRS